MCKFDIAWLGKCKKQNVDGEDYCEEHLHQKCSICGNQATYNCAETAQLVCGIGLCDSIECQLQHYYQHHGYAFFDIIHIEEQLGIKPFLTVISKVNYGEGKMAEFLNKKKGNWLMVLLLTFDKDGNIKFYVADYPYYAKYKGEISKLFEFCFEKKQLEEKGIYFYNDVIKINEIYNNDILDKLEKISLD